MKRSIDPQTLAYPTPAWVVGSYDQEGRPNAATVAWAGICCSKPPCVAVSLRDATYSHANLMRRRAFTLNIPSEEHARQVDYFGLVSGRKADKFAASGLTPVRADVVDAPYVDEFPVVLECAVVQVVELGSHTQYVGRIVNIKADESVLNENRLPDIEKVRPILFAPDNFGYYGVGEYLGKAFELGKEGRDKG